LAGRVRHLRSLGNDHSFWDVENVEAHVRTTLDAALDAKRARLNPEQYQRAFAFMWSLCWELSGLSRDGMTLRWCWEIRGFYAPSTFSEDLVPIKLPQQPTEERAQHVLDLVRDRRRLLLTSIAKTRPRGAYDPARGLAFSTYSRRVMMNRLTDWYRSDPEFGDNRYDGNRLDREISFEALAGSQIDSSYDDAAFLDRRSPGARLDYVDDLNRHAYQESLEEVLMRETASG
jgi:hypothetical protein